MNNYGITGQNSESVQQTHAVTQFELTKALYTSDILAKSDLTCSAKLFLYALCTHYNPKNKTMFPSQATVAKKLGISEKSAERAVKELKGKGLIDYETRKVNHYRFSEKFFSLINLNLADILSFKAQGKGSDKMSAGVRQNVCCDVRQNVGLTNNTEQKNKRDFSFFQKGRSAKAALQDGGKAVPSVEETRELLKERERIREEGFNPLDYSYEDAYVWIKSMPAFWLKKSKIARSLIEKYKFEDFLYTLDFEIENFREEA